VQTVFVWLLLTCSFLGYAQDIKKLYVYSDLEQSFGHSYENLILFKAGEWRGAYFRAAYEELLLEKSGTSLRKEAFRRYSDELYSRFISTQGQWLEYYTELNSEGSYIPIHVENIVAEVIDSFLKPAYRERVERAKSILKSALAKGYEINFITNTEESPLEKVLNSTNTAAIIYEVDKLNFNDLKVLNEVARTGDLDLDFFFVSALSSSEKDITELRSLQKKIYLRVPFYYPEYLSEGDVRSHISNLFLQKRQLTIWDKLMDLLFSTGAKVKNNMLRFEARNNQLSGPEREFFKEFESEQKLSRFLPIPTSCNQLLK